MDATIHNLPQPVRSRWVMQWRRRLTRKQSRLVGTPLQWSGWPFGARATSHAQISVRSLVACPTYAALAAGTRERSRKVKGRRRKQKSVR